MNLRWILLAGVAALLSGCAAPNLERIATVQNRAEALYAYSGVATFPVTSEVTETSIYAPVHRQREYQTIPIEREKPKPVISEVTHSTNVATKGQADPASTVAKKQTGSADATGNEQADASSAVTKEQAQTAGTVTIERTHSADAITKEQGSVTKAQESAAQTEEQSAQAAEKGEVQKESVVATGQAATQVEKPHAADIKQQTLAEDTRVSEQRPTLHSKVSNERVNVGEIFEFTMEFRNSTPVDLASVQLTNPIDPRLKLFEDQIRVKPNYKHHVSVGNGELVVRFAKELKRGKRVRVIVPVMFPVTSAAAAQ